MAKVDVADEERREETHVLAVRRRKAIAMTETAYAVKKKSSDVSTNVKHRTTTIDERTDGSILLDQAFEHPVEALAKELASPHVDDDEFPSLHSECRVCWLETSMRMECSTLMTTRRFTMSRMGLRVTKASASERVELSSSASGKWENEEWRSERCSQRTCVRSSEAIESAKGASDSRGRDSSQPRPQKSHKRARRRRRRRRRRRSQNLVILATLLNQLFAGLVAAGSHDIDALSNTTTTAVPVSAVTDISSLVAFLFSFAALRDWLKLIFIGGSLEALRRCALSTYDLVLSSFWVTAYFDDDDDSYNWMMVWLSKQPNWNKAREVEVSTRSFGREDVTILVPGEEDDAISGITASRKLAYLPSVKATYSIWYKRRLVLVSRVQSQGGFYGKLKETLQVSIMTRSHKFLNEILLDAKKQYMADQENTISIYVSSSRNEWRHVASRPKRPLRSIVLDPGIKDLLVNDAREFLESKKWYTERGIPFRRGYLLYGAPGSGKTSIIHSLAGQLGLDIYIISLSRSGLDDSSLSELISDLPEKCIALMEDIDAAFHQSLNRDNDSDLPEQDQDGAGLSPVRRGTPPRSSSRISLSGLLNALDGIGAQEGRLLYATTNKFSALDSALCRPGRMDVHVEFKLASKYQARELYRAFYLPPSDDEEGTVSASGSFHGDSIDQDDGPVSKVEPAISATVSSRSSRLSHARLVDLAEQFGETLPEREFSMASLQGYLMMYKSRPFEAVTEFDEWIKKERAGRLEKERASSRLVKLAPTTAAPATPDTLSPTDSECD